MKIKISYTYNVRALEKLFDTTTIIRLYLCNHNPLCDVTCIESRLRKFGYGDEFLAECDKLMDGQSDILANWQQSIRDEQTMMRLYEYYAKEML